MKSKDKGDIAELKLAVALKQKGYIVSFPYGDNAPYDLLIDDGILVSKIQCKHGRYKKGCVLFITKSSTRSGGKRVETNYVGKVDFFGVYCAELDTCYLIPIDEVAKHGSSLRVEESKSLNNKIKWAKNYEIKN